MYCMNLDNHWITLRRTVSTSTEKKCTFLVSFPQILIFVSPYSFSFPRSLKSQHDPLTCVHGEHLFWNMKT